MVDAGPSAVTAVTSAAPTGEPRGFLANIAAEALDPSIGKQEDILSWTIPVEIDCDKRQVRIGDMTGYGSRDLKSAPRVVRAADNTWVTPSSTAPLGAVLRSMCDRDYKRPFGGGARWPPSRPRPRPPTGAAAGSWSTCSRPSRRPRSPTPWPPTGRKAAAGAGFARPPAAAPIAHGTSPFAVQVGASPSQDDARALLDARAEEVRGGALCGLQGRRRQPPRWTARPSTARRSPALRARGAANALCDQLKAGGQACFVRR